MTTSSSATSRASAPAPRCYDPIEAATTRMRTRGSTIAPSGPLSIHAIAARASPEIADAAAADPREDRDREVSGHGADVDHQHDRCRAAGREAARRSRSRAVAVARFGPRLAGLVGARTRRRLRISGINERAARCSRADRRRRRNPKPATARRARAYPPPPNLQAPQRFTTAKPARSGLNPWIVIVAILLVAGIVAIVVAMSGPNVAPGK